MRNSYRSLLCIFVLLVLCQCKNKSGDNPGPDMSKAKVLEASRILDLTDAQFLAIGRQTNAGAQDVLALTAEWLKTQTGVKKVVLFDSAYIYITTANDLTTIYGLNLVDEAGKSYFRGGGKSGANLRTTGNSSMKIENRKVLIYAAYPYFFNPNTEGQFKKAASDFEVTILKGPQCLPRLIETFGNYGMVIINTHGETEGFLTGASVTIDSVNDITEAIIKGKVEASVGAGMYDKLLNDHIRIGMYRQTTLIPVWATLPRYINRDIWVTSSYIESLPQMPGTIIFGNMCHSGYTLADPDWKPKKPIGSAFNSRGLITYFNYAMEDGRAAVVNDGFAMKMEDSLIKALLVDGDSTGNAHLKPDGGMYLDTLIKAKKNSRLGNYFKQSGSVNYSYSNCMDSFTDGRDLQRYASICIGDQIWMAENLNYNSAGSVCYDHDADNCGTYGRLYKWDAAMAGAGSSSANPSGVQGVCPSNWHLPSHAEWLKLSGTLGGMSVSGGPLKAMILWDAPNTGATNSSGFTALPGGVYQNYISNPPQFNSVGQTAFFWTTTAFSTERTRVSQLLYDDVGLTYAAVYISETYVSVRCVKNK